MSALDDANEIQRRMYEFIVSYMNSEGMPPTNREIGRELKIASTGHIDYHLTMLEKKGFISRQAKKSRGITLIKPTVGIPVVGTIAGGEPLDIFPDSAQAVDVGRNLVEDDSTYALVVKGRSMIEDYICDGDYVIVKPQPSVQNGDIVVAVHMQEGISGSTTLKRFYQEKDHDRVRLQPANSALEPILIPRTVWDREWQVQGKVEAIYRLINANIDQDTATSMQTSKTAEIVNKSIEDSKAIASQVVSESLYKSTELGSEENSNASNKSLEASSNHTSSEAPQLVGHLAIA
jgi:repressor LexA